MSMVKNIFINQVHTDSLSCEPLLERTANGELLCVCQCDGPGEPDPLNRVYAFHSKDEGKTWSEKDKIYPEDGRAVYCTELTVDGDEITAYLSLHTGRFLDWKCTMVKSFDNGYTWKDYGPPPFLTEYGFMRGRLITRSGTYLMPYQKYALDDAECERVKKKEKMGAIWFAKIPYCDNCVMISNDKGKTYENYLASRTQMLTELHGIIWTEPTLAELSDGTVAMLMRHYGGAIEGGGYLYRCDSKDGGKTWCPKYKTDIPNPANKPRLFMLDRGKIALINTPDHFNRYPLELWISDDDMKTWKSKTTLTDFPGTYCYTDGFYENGHLKFVIEHNRHSILYFDVEIEI